jgi:hypothetical protein
MSDDPKDAEIARLTTERDIANERAISFLAETKAAGHLAWQAVEVLRDLEWHGPVGGEFKSKIAHSCPSCGAPYLSGHVAGCALARLIGKEPST